jgi:hypothetical protein
MLGAAATTWAFVVQRLQLGHQFQIDMHGAPSAAPDNYGSFLYGINRDKLRVRHL